MNEKDSYFLEARNIHKSYMIGRDNMHVLRGADLRVRKGEFLAIMGSSGSGKSTLLHILGLLDKPDKGQVHFEGESVFKLGRARQDQLRNRDIGFVFQFYHLLPELNVRENVMLPLMVASSLWSWPGQRRKARQRVDELLEAVGLTGQARQYPATLSGGERQRAAIARALIQQPKLLLADEPTGNLDARSGRAIMDILVQLSRQHNQTIVMVTHDRKVADLTDKKVDLVDGKIIGGT